MSELKETKKIKVVLKTSKKPTETDREKKK